MLNRLVSIAPMMEWTDCHYRYFLRLISPHALLYTEMVTTGALLHGDKEFLLGYHSAEHPIALQLGGSNPLELAECARIVADYGYDEVNLNVGCPSDRVQKGRFGACLMKEPTLVADCVASMKAAVDIPVTVKTRIGVDEQDSYEALSHFIETVAAAGCNVFIIHARKAWLKGLSPKENRDIPPLQYDTVKKIKQHFPSLTIIINGGINTLPDITNHLTSTDGVMIGRKAYYEPYFLAEIEKNIFGNKNILSQKEIIQKMLPYIESVLRKGGRLHAVTRHLLGLFHGEAGARAWRRYLSEHGVKANADLKVIESALLRIP